MTPSNAPSRRLKIIALAALALLLSSSPSSAETIDKIVAVINDSVITQSELNAAAAVASDKLSAEDRKSEKRMGELKARMLDTIVEQKLVKQASDRAGIEVSEKEIDNAVEEVKRQNNMPQEAFMLALAQNGLTLREYREQVKEQIRQVKFMDKEFRSRITVPDEDILDYYKQNADEFTSPAAFRIRMIFLSSGDVKHQLAKFNAIKADLGRGRDFSAVAREYSDSPTAGAGGDLGYVKPGEIDRELEEVAWKLKPGETGKPVFKADGIYILKVEDAKAGTTQPLEKVRDRIYEKIFKKIMDARFAFWLKEVKKYAHIVIRL